MGPLRVHIEAPEPDVPEIQLSAGLALPARLAFEVDDFEGYNLRFGIALDDGRYVCRALEVQQRDGGPPVTAESIRTVPVKEIVRAGVRNALLGRQLFDTVFDAVREQREPAQTYQVPAGLKVKGPPTDDLLRWVAQTYELAYALNDPPTKSVQDALGVSRATAGRWVAEARRRGLLDIDGGSDG
jgi:hypothetical protein